jgi:hypothetical protein
LPIEVMFRAQSSARTRSLQGPADMNLSVVWSEKGSYRQEHILRYLAKWLDPWTDERVAAADYRLLMMDMAGSHVQQSVVDFAWSRGYMVLYHYGGITGVLQVNDTDLHGPFQRIFLEQEQQSFNEKQELRPGCIARSPREVLDDVATTWRRVRHDQAVNGHKYTFLTCALDGSEDKLVSREALECWLALDMPKVRQEVKEQVDKFLAAGGVTIDQWTELIEHPADPGVMRYEGQEFEGDLEGPSWQDEDFDALVAEDNRETEEAGANPKTLVTVEPGDSPAAVVLADVAAKRLENLKRLREASRRSAVPGAFFSLDTAVRQLEKGRHAKAPADREVESILRRHVEKRLSEQRADLDAKRAVARHEDAEANKVKQALKAANLKKTTAAAERKLLKQKLSDLPKIWDAATLGKEGKDGTKLRRDLLQRLKLRSPKLSFAREARWPAVRDDYIRRLEKIHKGPAQVGVVLAARAKACIKALGSEGSGFSTHKAKDTKGDPEAFLRFYLEMVAAVPKSTTAFEL